MWNETSYSQSRARKYLRISFAFFRVRLNAAKVTLAGMFVFGLLVFFMDYRDQKLTSQLKAKVVEVTLPILSFSTELSRSVVQDIYVFFHPDHKYALALKRKDNRISSLKEEVLRLQNEINHLKQNLQFKERSLGEKWIATSVFLPVDFQSTHKGFVRLGEEDRVYKNCPVVSQNGLVGKLSNISTQSSEVLLIGHPLLAIPVYVERTNHQCVVKGSESGNLVVDYVEYSELQEGDQLLTSGQGGVFPRGIKVAKVQRESGKIILLPVHEISQTYVGYVLASGIANDAR